MRMKIGMVISVFLFCHLALAGPKTDLRQIMNKNAYYSNTAPLPGGTTSYPDAVQPPTLPFVTNGKPIKGWLFASETSAKITMSVSVDSGISWLGITAANDTNEANWGGLTDFGITPLAGKHVVVKVHIVDLYGVVYDYYSNSIASDGWCHLRAMDFPGYKSPSANIGDGIWLGWEDWMGAHDDYNDMCFILQGIGMPANQKLPSAYTSTFPARITWREENKY